MTRKHSTCAAWYFHFTLVLSLLAGLVISSAAMADVASRVITSIKPVHSLVSIVMIGVGEPHLMMRGAASPHAFSLRPSDAVMLKDASIVFLIDKSMETSLANPVRTLASDARVVMLSEAQGLIFRRMREGGAFEAHGHEHEEHSAKHGENGHESRGVGAYDMHLWLDPANAAVMARMIAGVLSEADPTNASVYEANTKRLLRRLEELTADITAETEPVRNRPFIVLHDAYRYFEDRFGLSAAGSVMVGSEQSPGVRRIKTLRNKVLELGATCVFVEPQFDSRLVDVIVEGTPAKVGILDPLGASIKSGPEAYFTLLHNMATSFRNCLAPADQ